MPRNRVEGGAGSEHKDVPDGAAPVTRAKAARMLGWMELTLVEVKDGGAR